MVYINTADIKIAGRATRALITGDWAWLCTHIARVVVERENRKRGLRDAIILHKGLQKLL